MTNQYAPRANGEELSRADMQCEAVIIETLLDAAMATRGGTNPDEAYELVEIAHRRATELNRALDSTSNEGSNK